jgi:hypothetical protein
VKDFIVSDSSQLDTMDMRPTNRSDAFPSSGIYVGIIRSVTEDDGEDFNTYVVECFNNNLQFAVICRPIFKFGGIYNFEEFNLRPWNPNKLEQNLPISADSYEYRNGDVVVVGLLNNTTSEGVIFGGLQHDARSQQIPADDIQYYSIFQGLEKQIRTDGSYKVTFNGAAVNEALLQIPPSGVPAIDPIYNPLTSGSYYGFDSNGSFIATDASTTGPQVIKINKDPASGSVILKSGQVVVEVGGNPVTGQFGAKATSVTLDALQAVNIGSKLKTNIQGTQLSLKGLQVAIGNDNVELVSALVELITELGLVIVNSPVGTCTPISTSPNWASKVIPLQVKLQLLAGSLQDAESFSLNGDDSEDLGDDISR